MPNLPGGDHCGHTDSKIEQEIGDLFIDMAYLGNHKNTIELHNSEAKESKPKEEFEYLKDIMVQEKSKFQFEYRTFKEIKNSKKKCRGMKNGMSI